MKIPSLIVLSLSLLAFGLSQVAFAPPAFASSAAKSGEKKEEKKEKGKEGEAVSGGRFDGDPMYVHMAPMVVPVINDNGVEQLVSLSLSVQVKDRSGADAIYANMPRVIDSLLRHLYGELGQGTLSQGKIVNISKIKSKATAAVREIIGNENVHDVLVQGIAQRML